MQEDAVAALAPDGAADHVDGPHDLAALALELLHGHQRVARLAGLRDGDVQRVRVHDRAAVAELAGRLGVGGDAGELLDQVRAHLPRVVGGAAAEELDPLDVAQLAGVQVDAAELRGGEPLVEAAHDRAADGVRLLVDLLAHVVAEGAELVVVLVRVHRRRRLDAVIRRPGQRPRVEVGRLDRRDLAVLQVDDLAGVADERGDVRGDEHLAVAEAEHDRRAVAGDDQLVGVPRVEEDEPVGALDAAQRPDDGLFERGVVVLAQLGRHHVRERLGVSVGDELHARGGELGAERLGVFDDPVVDHGDAVLCVGVRVRVGVVRLAVGGPAGVADADRGLGLLRVELVPQVLHAAGRLGDLQPAAVDDGDARRVVAPVLEPVQPLDKHGGRVALADVSDDSAHGLPVLSLAVDHAAELALRRLGRAEPTGPQLARDLRPNVVVLAVPALEVLVALDHVLFDRLAEVRHHVRHDPRRGRLVKPGAHRHVADQVFRVGRVPRLQLIHIRPLSCQSSALQANLCPISGKNRPDMSAKMR